MVNLTLKFVSCCRAADLRISTAEVLDCMEQFKLIDISDEFQFRTVLRTNFAKSSREQSRFDQLYHLFFHEMKKDLTEDAAEATQESQILDDIVEKILQEGDLDDMDMALMEFLGGDPLKFIEEVHKIHTREEQAAKVLKSNMSQLASRLQVMLKINKMKSKVVTFMGGNHAHIDDTLKANIEAAVNKRFNNADQILNHEARTKNEGLKEVKNHDKHYNTVGEIPFSNLSKEEIEEVRGVINQLVRKLEEIATLRFSAANKGQIDIKKTLRRAGRYMGVPIEIKYRNKPLRKGKIVVLCDVSGSVWSMARFMLNILYSLQECFSKVKSFIFVSELAEVTDYFIDYEVNDAIERILNQSPINYYAPTDYGMSFQNFKNRHLQDLDKKTTLIIIGDARSNYQNPQDTILKTMREKCRRVIWLNPEQEKFWDSGDSEMYSYKAHCHEVRPCGNLNQLIDFIEELII